MVAELAQRNGVDICVKVKGHARYCDVTAGRVLPIDKWGNDGADALAVAGAEVHAVSNEIVELCKRRALMARAAQSMMLKVLKARADAERVLKGEAIQQEELDDVGDDPWQTQSPMYVPHPRSGVG